MLLLHVYVYVHAYTFWYHATLAKSCKGTLIMLPPLQLVNGLLPQRLLLSQLVRQALSFAQRLAQHGLRKVTPSWAGFVKP